MVIFNILLFSCLSYANENNSNVDAENKTIATAVTKTDSKNKQDPAAGPKTPLNTELIVKKDNAEKNKKSFEDEKNSINKMELDIEKNKLKLLKTYDEFLKNKCLSEYGKPNGAEEQKYVQLACSQNHYIRFFYGINYLTFEQTGDFGGLSSSAISAKKFLFQNEHGFNNIFNFETELGARSLGLSRQSEVSDEITFYHLGFAMTYRNILFGFNLSEEALLRFKDVSEIEWSKYVNLQLRLGYIYNFNPIFTLGSHVFSKIKTQLLLPVAHNSNDSAQVSKSSGLGLKVEYDLLYKSKFEQFDFGLTTGLLYNKYSTEAIWSGNSGEVENSTTGLNLNLYVQYRF
ncbi:MAG: hypothetical protein HOO06_10990 [Bdellovibrionaceae bacterium]|nr:hypothetical protein [Pseudobdellovibrionaceae bacterium]